MFETKESFSLSEHIGIWFWDNLVEYREQIPHMQDLVSLGVNLPLNSIPDGWIDPGYNGPFSRQPKWLNVNGVQRQVREGDVIGTGKVYFFPNGVDHVYGSKGKSHYQTI